jgi:hypothetical protein
LFFSFPVLFFAEIRFTVCHRFDVKDISRPRNAFGNVRTEVLGMSEATDNGTKDESELEESEPDFVRLGERISALFAALPKTESVIFPVKFDDLFMRY